ncbi:lyase family protein [Rhizobium beringeri]
MVKKAAALANHDLGLLSSDKCQAICEARDDLIELERDRRQFSRGYDTGRCWHIDQHERQRGPDEYCASQARKSPRDYSTLHPNDDVNLSQSTNDVYPTALRLTILRACEGFVRSQVDLRDAFRAKAYEFRDALKVGRTQLQDAVPMTAGQEFEAFAELIDEDIDQVYAVCRLLKEVNLGGSTIGTSINVPTGFTAVACGHLHRYQAFRSSLREI